MVREITEYDIVELREDFEAAPAGARGGVDKVFDDGHAMVEFTSMPAEMSLDRILVVPIDKLRLVEHARHS